MENAISDDVHLRQDGLEVLLGPLLPTVEHKGIVLLINMQPNVQYYTSWYHKLLAFYVIIFFL